MSFSKEIVRSQKIQHKNSIKSLILSCSFKAAKIQLFSIPTKIIFWKKTELFTAQTNSCRHSSKTGNHAQVRTGMPLSICRQSRPKLAAKAYSSAGGSW